MIKILLVEDDPFISEIYTKKFSSSGFEVVPAFTGRDALKKAHESTFDLVLLDMVLPELSGLDVLRELRTNKDYESELKIVIFSNLSGPEERQEALRVGANGFISKTEFTPSEVVVEVKRYLEQFLSQKKNASQEYHHPEIVVETSESITTASDKKHILLIEDEPVFIEMFGKALGDAGYNVTTERNGKVGLDQAKSGGFDLIITDHLVPSLSGKEIIQALRNNTATQLLPIFLLTASLEEDEVREFQASGMVNRSFLKTEITPSELASAVHEFFLKP